MYQGYDPSPSSRSPGSHRHQPQTLHRQSSRQFDAYGPPSGGPHYAPAEDPSRSYDLRAFERPVATIHHGGGGYDVPHNMPSNAWNTAPFAQNAGLSSLGAAGRIKQGPRSQPRGQLPAGWLDQPQGFPTLSLPGLGSGHPNPNHAGHQHREDNFAHDPDEELIPTAIVIKNIPFAVKKEQLVQLMTDLRLPLPYAFNYHFDNGVFRGLAFANFTTADETAQVIQAMNHFELHGRKLRVEYKKMLPIAERERIEREKRERRGQLEEQHRPVTSNTLQTQPSYSSLVSHVPPTSPSPVAGLRPAKLGELVDLNDPQVLQFYTQLVVFKETAERDSMTFPPTLTPQQRRIIHTLAHQLQLMHVSKGTSDQRQVHIFKVHDSNINLSPPLQHMVQSHTEQPRRGLNRAATTDFSDVRASEGFYQAFGTRHASGLLGFPDSPGGLNAAHNLRAAKSYADLRSFTPSPAPSTASHPIGRLGSHLDGLSFGGSTSTNPNGTPTPTSMSQREDLLEQGLSRLQIGSSFGQAGSPRALRQMTSWENPGPIGGHRSFGVTYEDQSLKGGLPSRQPRGPMQDRGMNFSRPRQNGHQGRGSDELSSKSNVEIVVGQ
ncbi:hypothetical protein M011DRAFT_397146 [Sporormia fimetaria CBS 119925]|uniref:R3H domain protein n=1 Tax=Sporormia fimetaria CBS 119925 TaxID=1340428 RepID=A0A6A6VM87_9PLEO|nr:hypothetical protein M011DRAFT_397146 [Sporormia fimetaria CBS 119925]